MSRDYWFAFGGGTASIYSGLQPTFITFMNDSGSGIVAPGITEIASKGLYLCQYAATQTIVFTLDGFTTSMAATDRFINGVFDPYDLFGATLNAVYVQGITNTSYSLSNQSLQFAFGFSLTAIGNTNTAIGMSIAAQGISITAQGVSITAQGVTNIAYWGYFGSSFTAQGTTLVGIGGAVNSIGFSLSSIGLAIGTTASSYGSTSVDPVDLYGFMKRCQEFNEGNKTYTKATGLLDYFIRGGATLLREKTVSDSSTNTTTT